MLASFRQRLTSLLIAILTTLGVNSPLCSQTPAHALNNDSELTGRPGPWGQITIRSVYLEAPDVLLMSKPKPNSVPRWCFNNTTDGVLKELFDRAKLPADFQTRLFDPRRRIVQQKVLILFPLVPDLEAMTMEMRNVIYPELAKLPDNDFHQIPICIPSDDLDDWLRTSSLAPELQALIRKMVWRRGGHLVFSDVRTLLQHSSTMEEAWSVFKTVTRTRTLFVEVTLPSPESNATGFLKYWTDGNPEADTLPLLRAAISRGNVGKLDIVHFLPPIPRRRLHTYPTLDLAAVGRLPDCHWSSLNFFSSSPQNYYLDSELVGSRLSDDYDPVRPPYRFGDVLCYYRTPTITVHSCVYVADDIVFTKNGENILAPWVLMRIEDVNANYLLQPGWFIQGYRLKNTRGH